jgi:hypothetical protein
MQAKTLYRLYQSLKKEYPELLGLGIGWRTEGGRLKREPAVRLVVAEKKSKRSKSYRKFPPHIELKAGRGKRPAVIRLYTDVEKAREWTPTSFPLFVNNLPVVTAACYARWNAPDGQPCVGVVTVAHAFAQVGQAVGISTPNGVANGVLYLRSDLIRHGIDVGLVELRANVPALIPCLPPQLNPGTASINSTISLIGLLDTDPLISPMQSFAASAPFNGRALAYYAAMTISAPSGQSYALQSVVMADGPLNAFAAGNSGSPWVVFPQAGPIAVALQSHGHAGSGYRLGLGIHLESAFLWLRSQPQVQNLIWSWKLP